MHDRQESRGLDLFGKYVGGDFVLDRVGGVVCFKSDVGLGAVAIDDHRANLREFQKSRGGGA